MLTFFIILLLCSYSFVSCSRVYFEDNSSKYINTPRLKAGPTHFNLTAPLTYDYPFKSGRCDDSPNVENATGKVVMILGEVEGCTRFFKRVKPLQQQGAVGIVFARNHDRGNSGYFYYWARCFHGDCDGINIPLVELDQDTSKQLHERLIKGENLTMHLTNDHNYYAEPVESGAYYAFSVISVSVSVCLLSLASFRLYRFVQAKGWCFSLNNMIFGLEIIGSLLRIIWCIDPYTFYFLYPIPVTHFLATLHLVPFLAANMLLACYWQESLLSCQIMEKIPKLRRFKWPALGVIIVLLISDLTAGALRSYSPHKVSTPSYYVIGFFYAVVAISVGSFFFSTGFILIRKLRSQAVFKLSGQVSKRSLYKLTALVITCATGEILMTILAALYSVVLNKKAWLMYIFTVFEFLVVDSMCLAQLMVFQLPRKTSNDTELNMVKSPSWQLRAQNEQEEQTINTQS